jgi:hypothetical protein
MSSWANIRVPRKRDISQIPAELRPTIIPRAARQEVILSEFFQEDSQNEIILSTRVREPARDYAPVLDPKQYPVKKIDNIINPKAIELTYKDKSYVFIILRHLRSTRDNDLWISSYNSIRKFYTNKIVIIDDNSQINTVDGKLINTEIIRSEFNGAGEILPYYYFLKHKWADKMIFLHDSMFINRPFRDTELEGDIKFHWYFNGEGINDFRKISNYVSLLTHNAEIHAYITDTSAKWNGCFGAASICDKSLVEYLEIQYKLFSTLVLSIRTRKDRESFERVLGIVLYYEGIFNGDECSNFGNIMRYPNAFETYNSTIETAENNIRQRGYDTAVMKVWRGR